MPSPRKHLYTVGDVVGRMTVVGIELHPRPDGRNRRMLRIQCSCGSERLVLPSNVGSGMTSSCGCLQKEKASSANKRHGARSKDAPDHKRRLLSVWRGIRQRCNNPNAHNYRWYGGKGVQVEWESFEDFYAWAVTHGYEPGLELDRRDSDGNYSSENCRWITKADNLVRAFLHLSPELDSMVDVHLRQNQGTLIDLITKSLFSLLAPGEEVMKDGN